jgi:hypothetical protein
MLTLLHRFAAEKERRTTPKVRRKRTRNRKEEETKRKRGILAQRDGGGKMNTQPKKLF